MPDFLPHRIILHFSMSYDKIQHWKRGMPVNLPNILTVLRFFMIPLFVFVFFRGGEYRYFWAVGVFTLASATDVLDGYIARKYHLVTNFGKLADPAADKAMQITALVCMSIVHIIPWWVLVVVLVKELCMMIGGLVLLKKKIVVSANQYGKTATVVFYVSIVLLIVFGNMPLWCKYFLIGLFLFFTLLALLQYAKAYRTTKK